jgi:glycosyltransferase involved in cell wall biosynthesis
MRVSVIVPVRNEEHSIRALLDSLLGQTRRPDEIVITDGGSSDATAQIVGEYIKRGDPVQLIRERAALPGRGRNVAIAHSSGEWLAFADSGTRPVPGWLGLLVERVERDPGVDMVYGAMEPVVDSFFKECAAIAYLPPPSEVAGGRARPNSLASALLRREVWQAVGGFREDLRSAEDILFMDSVAEKNFRIVHEPRALVHWNIQPTPGRTFRRFVTYSRHNIRAGLWRRWQSAVFKRYALLALSMLPVFWFGVRWLLASLALWTLMLMARSLVALRRNAAVFTAGIGRNGFRLMLLVPLIALIDGATILGSIDWLFRDKLRFGALAKSAEDEEA